MSQNLPVTIPKKVEIEENFYFNPFKFLGKKLKNHASWALRVALSPLTFWRRVVRSLPDPYANQTREVKVEDLSLSQEDIHSKLMLFLTGTHEGDYKDYWE